MEASIGCAVLTIASGGGGGGCWLCHSDNLIAHSKLIQHNILNDISLFVEKVNSIHFSCTKAQITLAALVTKIAGASSDCFPFEQQKKSLSAMLAWAVEVAQWQRLCWPMLAWPRAVSCFRFWPGKSEQTTAL